MLDLLSRYSHPTQPFFIAAFLVWWLVGATWLLHRAVRKYAEQKKPVLGLCALSVFLSGVGAAIVGGMVLRLFIGVGERLDWGEKGGYIVGGCLGAVLAVPMALLVLYAVFQFPLGRLLRVSWLPLGSIVLAAAVFGGPAFYLGRARHVNEGMAAMSVKNLREIDQAIRTYEGGPEKAPPKDLLTLTQEFKGADGAPRKLPKSSLVCPFLPGDPVGYFYFPCPSVPETDKLSQALRACEWKHPDSDRYRSILLANGEVRATRDADFQSVLDANENVAFAKAYRAAEANRR